MTLVDVDCTAENGKEVCSKHGVSGYPTLKIFRDGEVSQEYNGPREAGKCLTMVIIGSRIRHQCNICASTSTEETTTIVFWTKDLTQITVDAFARPLKIAF